jgi:hypothetical protein
VIPRLGRVLRNRRPGTTPATEPSPEIADNLRRLATWLFMASSLFEYVYSPAAHNYYLKAGQIGLSGFALLTLVAIFRRSVPLRTLVTIGATGALLFGLLLLYAALWPAIRGSALGAPSQKSAVVFVAYCTAAVAYALVFYREEIFTNVYWKAAIVGVILAIAAYIAHVLFHTGWLVHRQYGTPRLQGLLSEPSAWAPFMPSLLLLALGRRRYIWAAIFVVAAALTKSPTILLGMALAVPAYYALAARRRSHRLTVFVSVTTAYTALICWLQSVSIDRPLSTGLVDQFVFRLASGVHAMESGGTEGRNDRFSGTQSIIHDLATHGWLAAGIGPGAEGYILEHHRLGPNALPVYLLACFGIIGVLVFAVLVVIAAVRLRKFESFRIFLPFIVASLINSADGWESYKFVVVAIVLSLGVAVGKRADGVADRAIPRPAEGVPSAAGSGAAE